MGKSGKLGATLGNNSMLYDIIPKPIFGVDRLLGVLSNLYKYGIQYPILD